MKLALIVVPKTDDAPMLLCDSRAKAPPMLLLGWPEQLSMLLVFAVGGLWMWFGLIEPAYRKTPQPAVRVARAQQVMFLEPGTPLSLGDSVYMPGTHAPSVGKIAALPRQSVSGPEYFMILGAEQYYVVGADGAGRVVHRADIRGVVQTAPL